ncbi:hamartin [Trichogramma pretiosum]|uniref:hamartin n=1 Tax=Trichogramma pretiosum TaxID=7493 RepID=UPI0006C977BA|nr:hamartin [Trichogramma pretiosum]XP_014230738.1 hamartin [Trichogramma pretiosum]
MTNNNSSYSSNGGAAELFHLLESNKLSEVEETKQVLHDHFQSTKDNWLVHGLFDYYLSTESLRAVEVLSGVREPHDKHLFDKLTDVLAAKVTTNEQKVKTLTLLGHVARRQPTWLYKLASHTLFKQLLHLLKVEESIVLIVSALLLLITLLPMLPTALTPHLNEIFEVFSRLASFYFYRYASNTPAFSLSAVSSLNFTNCSETEQPHYLHLQVGLQNFFHRLYAMYPCNFVSFLKQQYIQRDQMLIFKKIIGPMLDSVRMHPLLITMSKELETSSLRWKKMEHHDVVAECSRFSLLDKISRDETVSLANMRFTPVSDTYSYTYTPVSNSEFPFSELMDNCNIPNGNHESFWSPSMSVVAHSPPMPASLQVTPLSLMSHMDTKSAPPTPGIISNNSNFSGQMIGVRSRTSPPEAAVEATPETTPVKDLRQPPFRQLPVGSAAVRGIFGNGTSRTSTPSPHSYLNQHHHLHHASVITGMGDGGVSIIDRKLGKIVAERQAVKHEEEVVRRTATPPTGDLVQAVLNGRVDSQAQLEDQEVSDIVSSKGVSAFVPKDLLDKDRQSYSDLSRRVKLKCYRNYPTPPVISDEKLRRAESCPDLGELERVAQQQNGSIGIGTFRPVKSAVPTSSTATEEIATQTCGLLPYEYVLLDTHRSSEANTATPVQQNISAIGDQRTSPSSMLERYIELCARSANGTPKNKSRQQQTYSRRSRQEDEIEHSNGSSTTLLSNDESKVERLNQQLQLMQMQLQFERQRREVHAERNRRLLGKLRDSRALEELNSSMTNRLKLAKDEIDSLTKELSHTKTESRTLENKLHEAITNWQNRCKEEQHKNVQLQNRIESLEDELKDEQKRVMENVKQTRAAEATLFEAAHQLKEALRAANQSEELKRALDATQKKFLLLGETHARTLEKINGPTHMARQETALLQRSWSEEVSNLRRQLDQQSLQLESLKSRQVELEHRDARKEVQLIDQQRLLQESKEKHTSELEAVESKYKAQLEINLLLEGRILELHGKLEQATYKATSPFTNSASSGSPKERSPPLSTSLASSNDGSATLIPAVVNECDAAGEIANLQAIIEPKELMR